MSDAELIDFLGLSADPLLGAKYVAGLSPEKRALYERMAEVETEIKLWQEGVGPKPTQGVILCKPSKWSKP